MAKAKKGYIVISLGDDGAIATCFEKGLLVKRYFLANPFSPEFSDLVKSYPEYPIYLLLDTIDQNYVFSNFPALRSGNLMKMVNRKITNEFDPSDINAYLCLGKDEESVRKDLKYVFVSIRNASPLTDWFEAIRELPNKFMGLYLYPIESEDLIVKLQKHFPKDMGEGNSSKWRILISHNRVGGFRQVVYKDNKIIFTRISQASNIQSPDSIGVNISQEAANTLEYIRRIGFNDNSLVVYVVCVKEAFQFIEIPGIESEDVGFVTPYEFSEKLGLKGAAMENDKFGDVIFASNFLSCKKKKLKIVTEEFKKLEKLSLIDNAVRYSLKFLIFLLPLLILYSGYMIYDNMNQISEQEDLSRNYKKQISSIKSFEDQFGVDPDFLVNMVEVDEKITQHDKIFQDMLGKFSKVILGKAHANNFNFKRDDKEFIFTSTVFLETKGINDYADLIIKSKEFAGIVKEEFKDYEVRLGNMPSQDNIKLGAITKSSGKAGEKGISLTIKGRAR